MVAKPVLLALALMLQHDPAPWLRADTVVVLPDHPRITLIRRPEDPRVALRWFVPVHEEEAQAGAGRVLALLAQRRAESYGERLGATLTVRRTPAGIAYSVAGSRLDLDHLFDVLRVAMGPPESDPVLTRRARASALEQIDRDLESAERNLASRLAGSVCPGSPPIHGTRATLAELDGSSLQPLWERTHQTPAATQLVVVGDLPIEVILAALPRADGNDLMQPRPGRLYAGTAQPNQPGRPQVLRQWYGESRPAGSAADPRGAVAARLLGRQIGRMDSGVELTLELVDAGCTTALVILGGAYRQSAPRLRRAVETLITNTRDRITEGDVTDVALEIRRSWVRRSATPEGVAELVGGFEESDGRGSDAESYLGILVRIDRQTMIEYFDALLATPPVRAELGSQ
ncbi:MAG: hypothetical protein R3E10_11045 [Gemmatimonadota bacterium]